MISHTTTSTHYMEAMAPALFSEVQVNKILPAVIAVFYPVGEVFTRKGLTDTA